ncbi:MAG: type III-B CRISPR module RAMP protein Cmr6 [Verrucomicrobia bacterium]|nr:type III-B CRISPR module RAMP protein Cmr6 [Verrucomicrobiota bacterium]
MIAASKSVQIALNKRCDAWHLRLDKLSYELGVDATAKTSSLKAVSDCYNKLAQENLMPVCRTRQRFLQMLEQQHGSSFAAVDLVLESRLLLHLARPNVLENVGLYCDRTTGLPQIPGTALKGLLSTWVCWANHFNPADGSFTEFKAETTTRKSFAAAEARLAQRILGDNSADGSERAGDVIFIAGFPLTPPRLGLDIVNPHFEPEGKFKTRLTPNAFLCIEPGTIWRFAFYVRPGAPNPDQLIHTTKQWITEALTQLGIGAKTAAGYGRFRLPTDSDLTAVQRGATAAAATQPAAQKKTAQSAEDAKRQAAAQAMLASDYPNDREFNNRVLSKLTPGTLDQLQSEIALLQKPENMRWLDQLKKTIASKDYKDIRKRLRQKDWFPKEWLPQQ